MKIPLANPLFRSIQQQPRWVGIGLGAAFLAWTAVIGYTFFISPQPSESAIAGQTVQLNVSQLQAVTKHLERYRTPVDIPAVRETIWVTPQP